MPADWLSQLVETADGYDGQVSWKASIEARRAKQDGQAFASSSVSDFDNTLLNQNGFAILELPVSCGRFFGFSHGC